MILIINMTFNHKKLDKKKRPFVKMLDTEKGHYYQTENGEVYPSITTVKDLIDPKEWYPFWIAKIMRDNPEMNEKDARIEAKRIGKASMDVGTALHKLAEDYMNNEKNPEKIDGNSFEKNPNELFIPLKKFLDEHVNNIYATESKMFHKELQIAGTVDWVAELDGVLTVGDFKNSRKPKMPSEILKSGYYSQATAYALMFQECYGIKVEQIAIVVISWDGKVRVFKSKIYDHYESLLDMLIKYESEVTLK